MILYHFTPLVSLKKVLSNGLVPRIGARSRRLGERRPAIYFFPTIAEAEEGLVNWLMDQFGESTRIAFLAVTIPEGMKIYSDVSHERHVYDPIPPQCIRVISKDATGDSGLSDLQEMREGPFKDGRILPRLDNGLEPKVLYRIMSLAEYKAGQQRSAFVSRDGRLHASETPQWQYCEPGDQNVLVSIRYDDDDGWKAKQTMTGVVAITDEPLMADRVKVIGRGTRADLEQIYSKL